MDWGTDEDRMTLLWSGAACFAVLLLMTVIACRTESPKPMPSRGLERTHEVKVIPSAQRTPVTRSPLATPTPVTRPTPKPPVVTSATMDTGGSVLGALEPYGFERLGGGRSGWRSGCLYLTTREDSVQFTWPRTADAQAKGPWQAILEVLLPDWTDGPMWVRNALFRATRPDWRGNELSTEEDGFSLQVQYGPINPVFYTNFVSPSCAPPDRAAWTLSIKRGGWW